MQDTQQICDPWNAKKSKNRLIPKVWVRELLLRTNCHATKSFVIPNFQLVIRIS